MNINHQKFVKELLTKNSGTNKMKWKGCKITFIKTDMVINKTRANYSLVIYKRACM